METSRPAARPTMKPLARRLRTLAAALAPPTGPRPLAPSAAAAAAAIPDVGDRYAQFVAPAVDVPFSDIGAVAGADPLRRLAAGEIPAIILRSAMAPADCRALVGRMHEQGHLPPAFLPFMDLDGGPGEETDKVSGGGVFSAGRSLYSATKD
jgi:hypothetical protein